MMKYLMLILISVSIMACGQDPLKASKSRMTSTSTSPLNTQQCRSNSGTVCGQPPMPVCPEGMVCAQVMPQPQDYSNECVMLQAGARLLYDGACNSTTP